MVLNFFEKIEAFFGSKKDAMETVKKKETEVKDVDSLCERVSESDYIASLRIGRSWILPQMVAMGFDDDGAAFSKQRYLDCLKEFSTRKLWTILLRNLKAMKEIAEKDPKGCAERARWWTREVAVAMAKRDMERMKRYVNNLCEDPIEYCSGGDYVNVKGLPDGMPNLYFVNEPNESWNDSNSMTVADLYRHYEDKIQQIAKASSPAELYIAVKTYYYFNRWFMYDDQLGIPAEYIKAYMGDGAYSSMITMVKFLDLRYHDDYGVVLTRDECIEGIEAKAAECAGDGEKLLDFCIEKFFDTNAGGTFDLNAYYERRDN